MILIFGENGQVGGALCALLGRRAIGLTRERCDLAQAHSIEQALERHRPAFVINAAAYTAVDLAESEREKAFAVNAHAPGIMAEYCAAEGIPFLHYSTDYIFDGKGNHAWREEDITHPLNTYGESKRAGEEAVMAAGGDHLIFRTSWVYDEGGRNFFTTMMRLLCERTELRIVADQYGAPTYAPHLAKATVAAMEEALAMPVFPKGIYHLAAGGETSWCGFAQAIRTGMLSRGMPVKTQRILPIASDDYPTPAKRPRNSRLDCGKAKAILGIALPAWQEGLEMCMDEYVKKLSC